MKCHFGRARLIGTFAVLVGLTIIPTGSANGSCAAPQLTGPVTPVAPGDTAKVSGKYFIDGCDDHGSVNNFGCSSNSEAVTPDKSIVLRLRQGSREWTLGTSDAAGNSGNRFGSVVWKISLPPDVRPGKAELETDYSDPISLTVQR